MDKPKDTGVAFHPNPFRTCDDKGAPVAFRFSSPLALRTVFKKAQDDDIKDSERRGRIKGLYDCRLPWDPQKLAAAGLGDKANFPGLDLKGIIDARAGVILDLALDNVDLVELRPATQAIAGPDADEVGQIVAEEFSAVVRTDPEFLSVLAISNKERDLYGFGPLMWPDVEGYVPVALKRGQIKLFEGAPALASRNEIIMVESTLPVDYVFKLFDTPAAAAAAGWNLPALKAYVVSALAEGNETTTQTGNDSGTSVLESRLDQMRQNRVFETKQFQTLVVVHAFVRETSGSRKITHYMIPGEETRNEWLMVRRDAYDTMTQAVNWLPASMTESEARGLRGVASFLCARLDISNRLECEALDAVRAQMRIPLSRSQGSAERMTISEQGPYAILPDGVEIVAVPQNQNMIQTALALARGGVQAAAANASGVPGPLGVPAAAAVTADRRTKEEVQLERERGARSEQSLFASAAMVFDSVFRESFRRFMKLALSSRGDTDPAVARFLGRCASRGVDEAKLREVTETHQVYTCRNLIAGGGAAVANLLTGVLELGGNLDEVGRLDATHDLIKARMGVMAARRYRPRVGRDTTPSDAAALAQLENNAMLELSPALAAPDQLHWSHIPIHGRLVSQIVEAVNNNQVEDPQKMLDMLELVSTHIQHHLGYGGRQIGKEDDAKAATRDIKSLRPVQQALTMMAATMDRARRAEAEKQQRELEDLQARAEGKDNAVKIHEIDTKAALKLREQNLQHEARMAEVSSRAQTDGFRVRAKAELERITANYHRIVDANRVTGGAPPSTSSLVEPGEGAELPFPG